MSAFCLRTHVLHRAGGATVHVTCTHLPTEGWPDFRVATTHTDSCAWISSLFFRRWDRSTQSSITMCLSSRKLNELNECFTKIHTVPGIWWQMLQSNSAHSVHILMFSNCHISLISYPIQMLYVYCCLSCWLTCFLSRGICFCFAQKRSKQFCSSCIRRRKKERPGFCVFTAKHSTWSGSSGKLQIYFPCLPAPINLPQAELFSIILS